MQTYSFTLTLKGHSVCSEEMADAIYAAGADDSGVSSSGDVVSVHFDRESASLDEAIRSAIRDLASAGFEASHLEIDDQTLALLSA